jgi:hypothetical protein
MIFLKWFARDVEEEDVYSNCKTGFFSFSIQKISRFAIPPKKNGQPQS